MIFQQRRKRTLININSSIILIIILWVGQPSSSLKIPYIGKLFRPQTEPLAWTSKDYRKPLHWVLKVTSLENSLNFFKLFGLKLFRHEEFSTGCEATCNGPYKGAWSKTLIGDGENEGDSFSLELTYNYGVYNYPRGNDLRYISVDENSYVGPQEKIKLDNDGRKFVESPDGHWFLLSPETRVSGVKIGQGIFQYVSLHVESLLESTEFYCKTLNAKLVKSEMKSCLLSFAGQQSVHIELVELEEGTLEKRESYGRFAISTEDGAPMKISESINRYKPSGRGMQSVLHGPTKLEPHGEEVVIVQDPDGHELCFVDARGFQNCIEVSKTKMGSSIDWNYRENLTREADSKIEDTIVYRPPVLQLSATDALKVINETKSNNLIFEVYAPWCSKCIDLKPFFERLATSLNDSGSSVIALDGTRVKLALDNGLSSDELEMMVGWTKLNGFPTLFYYNKSTHNLEAYEGIMNEEEILLWVNNRISIDGDLSNVLRPNNSQMEGKVDLLFDSECPICLMEVNFLKKRDIENKILFTDLSSPDYDPIQHGNVTFEEGMKRLKAVLPDGRVVSGVEVFRKVYDAIGLGWIFSVTKMPIIGELADVLYDIWAENRLKITGRNDLATEINRRASQASSSKHTLAKISEKDCTKCTLE